MSYYTILELTWDDADHPRGSITARDIVQAAAPYVEANGWHSDVLKDVEAATRGFGLSSPGFNGIPGFALADLLLQVSRELPQVTFLARGVGEEFGDLWLRRFRAGEPLEEAGPFGEEL